ncbi:hypothetical protein CVT25_005910 [Psilocybe cyanescens]|uniref:Uncharacterized protein n=1 Tax=Psilocybe cyanescens TaxID=93625 RepID=A0A409VM29_PSICY|nr:hypothetical protein CVT25_005910 [Psilocybe cyanescens]
MSLAQKHPLRLLLPPAIQSTINTSPTREPDSLPQEVDPDAVDDIFVFNKPASSTDHEFAFQPLPDFQLSSLTKSIVQDANAANLFAHASERMPFSTPGPGRRSVLGSSTESTVLFLPSSPRTPSSPTIYEDSHSGLDLRLVEPHIFCNSSDSGRLMNDRVENDCNVETDLFAPDFTYSSLFSEIYATPGPGYHSSRPIYYDYLAEGPLGSVPEHGFGMPCDSIDFQWHPFDRTNLVAPDISTRAAFAYGPGENIDSVFSAKPLTKKENPGTLFQLLECASPANVCSRAAPASPCPFRFLPPPECDHSRVAAVVPEIQEPVRNSIMAPRCPSAHVPGITLQVGLPQTATPSASDYLLCLQRTPSPFEHVATMGLINLPTNATSAVDDGDGKAIYSQASNDSIESWGHGTKQDIMRA